MAAIGHGPACAKSGDQRLVIGAAVYGALVIDVAVYGVEVAVYGAMEFGMFAATVLLLQQSIFSYRFFRPNNENQGL